MFISRLEAILPILTVKEFDNDMIGYHCKVEHLKTRHDNYSSFLVTCDYGHKKTVMNPEDWQEGVLTIRPFFGQPRANTILKVPPVTSHFQNEKIFDLFLLNYVGLIISYHLLLIYVAMLILFSSVDPSQVLVGRPYSGVYILWRKNISHLCKMVL